MAMANLESSSIVASSGADSTTLRWDPNLIYLQGCLHSFLLEIGFDFGYGTQQWQMKNIKDKESFLSAVSHLCGALGKKIVDKDSDINHTTKESLITAQEKNQKQQQLDDIEYLATKNSHPRDSGLKFDEDKHEYTILGQSQTQQCVRSVTAFCDSGGFNPNFIIPRILKSDRYSNDPTYEYYQMTREQILKTWDQGRDLGTELHRDIEIFLNKKTKLEDDFLDRKLSTKLEQPIELQKQEIVEENQLSKLQDNINYAGTGTDSTSYSNPDYNIGQFNQSLASAFGGANLKYNNDTTPSSFPITVTKLPPNLNVIKPLQSPVPDNTSMIERTYFLAFLKDVLETRKWKPYRTEWRIYDKDLKIAGTIDFVCTCDTALKQVSFDFGEKPEAKKELPKEEASDEGNGGSGNDQDNLNENNSTAERLRSESNSATTSAEVQTEEEEEGDGDDQIQSRDDNDGSESATAKRRGRPKKTSTTVTRLSSTDSRTNSAGRKSSKSARRSSTSARNDDRPYAVEPQDPNKVKQLIIIDWKRSKHCKKASYEKQLNLYRYLLMKNYNLVNSEEDNMKFHVRELYIVRLHPSSSSYDLVSVPIDEGLAIEALGKQGLKV